MTARHMRLADQASGIPSRVRVFDVVRGFSVISMVLFHFCYDLRFLSSLGLSWFKPPLQDIWRCSISWAFVFIAGCMFAWSRNNLRRAGRYLGVAALIFVVTTYAKVDVPINFGIIYCMGACTLTCLTLDALGFRPQGFWRALLLFACFTLLLGIPHGTVGIGSYTVALPRAPYNVTWLAWLGFPGPGFASGDYYPLLPYLLLYLSGSAMGRYWKSHGMPSWAYTISVPPLEWIGQHALPIYVLHQPVLLGLTYALEALVSFLR